MWQKLNSFDYTKQVSFFLKIIFVHVFLFFSIPEPYSYRRKLIEGEPVDPESDPNIER